MTDDERLLVWFCAKVWNGIDSAGIGLIGHIGTCFGDGCFFIGDAIVANGDSRSDSDRDWSCLVDGDVEANDITSNGGDDAFFGDFRDFGDEINRDFDTGSSHLSILSQVQSPETRSTTFS